MRVRRRRPRRSAGRASGDTEPFPLRRQQSLGNKAAPRSVARSGSNGSRRGFIAERLLASERERLALAGGARRWRQVRLNRIRTNLRHRSAVQSGGAGASGRSDGV